MSAITTLAPVLANATAVARPMPLEPPVITTTLSSKEDTFITSSSCLELFLGSALDGVEPRILHLRPAHCGFQDPHPGHHALLRGPVHLLGALFVFVEPRLREPLIDLSLFANRSYLGTNAVAFAQNFGFGAVMFFLTLYLQYVLDYSPLNAGLVFLPFTVLFTIGNLQAGRLASAIGPRLSMAGGTALIVAAFLLLALVTPTSGLAIVVVALVIAGVGQSLTYTISTTAGMGAISAAKAGAASGVLQMVRQLGVVFGVAVPGALFKALENSKLAELLAAAGARLDASNRAEILGLLSGSEAAERKVAELAPAVADQVEQVVR